MASGVSGEVDAVVVVVVMVMISWTIRYRLRSKPMTERVILNACDRRSSPKLRAGPRRRGLEPKIEIPIGFSDFHLLLARMDQEMI